MTSKRILVIQGHPDNSAPHLNHALADAYSDGARAAGHEIRLVTVSELDFPAARLGAWRGASHPENCAGGHPVG